MILTACGAPQSQKTEPLPKLTIGLMPDVDYLPFIIAQEKG
jgi:NitT/TauT family transport system substrate-binding protein